MRQTRISTWAHKSRAKASFWALGLAVLFAGCSGDYVPKPRGYPLITLPAHSYQNMVADLPYSFRYSQEAVIKKDTDRHAEPNWIHLYYPAFDASVECTYKPLAGNSYALVEYIETARKLINKHQVKASSIEEYQVPLENGDKAMVFRLKGQVPSQYQFYVTDSTKHFLRAALYFKTATKNDSLAPVIDYISQDMDTLLHTLRWKSR